MKKSLLWLIIPEKMSSQNALRLLVGGVLLLFLTQCGTVTSEPPKAEGFDPPIAPALSSLTGTLTFQLSELQEKINKELDPVLIGRGGQKDQSGSIFPFSVVRSGPVQIQYVDEQVRFSAPLQVQLKKLLRNEPAGPSDNPFCELKVDFSSPLTLTSNWRLASHVKFTGYAWITKPQIRLLGKDISLTNFAQKILERNQTTIETAIDSAVYRELRLDKMVRPIWRDIQKPLLINREYGLWLTPRPVRVVASPVRGDQKELTAGVQIMLTTQTELTPDRPVHAPTPLPQLQKRDQLPEQSNLLLLSSIPYADINRVLAQSLRDTTVTMALGALRIHKASVYGGQRSLIVKTEVSGLVDGTLYLRGRPTFDTTTNTLRVTNLDFDAQTKSVLSKVSISTLRSGLSRVLEDLLTVPFGEELDQLPRKINAAFEKSQAGRKTDLAIESFHFVPQRLAVRPDGIQVLINVRSKVAMQVQQL